MTTGSADIAVPSTDWLRSLPKLELHVHLEGTLSVDRIVSLAAHQGLALPRPADRLFEFADLSGFLEFLDWTCSLVASPELAAEVAYDYARRASDDGIVYAEVIVNPSHWAGWDLGELVEALTLGFERAEHDDLTSCHLLLSILRTQTAEEATALVDWIDRHEPRRVLGLSVDGNESRAGRTGPRFAHAYRRAGEIGLGRTAHAGESSGPEGVRDALDLLAVDRIDHGVRAVEDPELVRRLADEAVPLNVCITSNLVHLYRTLAEHPVHQLRSAGVPVTLNTDDPGYLNIDLTGELALLTSESGWTVTDVLAVQRTAIEAAFCPPPIKARLSAMLDSFANQRTEELT